MEIIGRRLAWDIEVDWNHQWNSCVTVCASHFKCLRKCCRCWQIDPAFLFDNLGNIQGKYLHLIILSKIHTRIVRWDRNTYFFGFIKSKLVDCLFPFTKIKLLWVLLVPLYTALAWKHIRHYRLNRIEERVIYPSDMIQFPLFLLIQASNTVEGFQAIY